MHIKVDEDLPQAVATLLKASGYECSTVLEQGLGGTKGPELWQEVDSKKLFLITADKGFGDVRTFPPGTHAGILLLRPDDDGIPPTLALIEQVLASENLEALQSAVSVATPRGIRVRRAEA